MVLLFIKKNVPAKFHAFYKELLIEPEAEESMPSVFILE